MRPIKIKSPSKWTGDVRYEVLGRIGTHIFGWTMDEVDEFLAQIAAEAGAEPEPPQPTISRKLCAECGREVCKDKGVR